MTKLPTIRRLASDILKCGRNKVWFDPNELARLIGASSRMQVRGLIKDGVILKKPDVVHSRWRANKLAEAKKKGRHMGIGKRRGTKNARMPQKSIWIKKIRSLRVSLKELKENSYITLDEYNRYYMQAKGNAFKSKKIMVDYIEKKRAEKIKIQELAAQTASLKMRK